MEEHLLLCHVWLLPRDPVWAVQSPDFIICILANKKAKSTKKGLSKFKGLW